MLLPSVLEDLLGLQNAMDRTFNTGFFDSSTSSRGVYPAVNIFEKDDDLVLIAELPGVKKEDMNIEVKGNTVRIAGERTIKHGEDISYHRIERDSSKFDRTLRLPTNVEAGKVKAEYKDGLLMLTLPRAEADKPKQITIQ